MSIERSHKDIAERKPPKPLKASTTRSIWNLVVGLVFLLVNAYFARNYTGAETSARLILILMVIFGLAGLWIMIKAGLQIIRPIYNQRKFLNSNASATATILDKWLEEHGGSDNKYTTFHVAFEFNPIEAAISTGKKTLKGEVAQNFWALLNTGQTVTARYSRDNPDIVSLEGE
jgi:hypothetical protein